MPNVNPKTYSSCYLYRKFDVYEKKIFSFLIEAEEIDKDIPEFEDIVYEVKRRQINSCILNVLKSKNVVLLRGLNPLDKAFKVFCAKDIKGPNKNQKKVFIDCSNIITKDEETGRYFCSSQNIDILISYLVSAMVNYIYYVDSNRLVANSSLVSSGVKCFSTLFYYIIDYIGKISTIPGAKNKCIYLCCLYYFANILELDYTTDTNSRIARNVSAISEREAYVVDVNIKEESFTNIKFFIETLADTLHLNKLTLDVFIERWMWLYGTGTVFATELFPAFASMITDAYVGAYINNQKTIEKVLGTNMNEFTKTILSIGQRAV